jgi:Fe-S-cluster containining protein
MSIPCDGCAAPCCRNYHVGIYAWDAWRIARALVVPMADFCVLDWLERADGDFRILLDTVAAPANRRHYTLALRKVADPDPRYRHRCVFLVSVGGRGRCGVYEHRPIVCSLYPTTVNHGVIGVDGGGRYCPPGSWQVADLDLVLARRRWLEYRVQRELHEAVIDRWNAGLLARPVVRREVDFLAFVDETVDRIMRIARAEPALSGELWRWPEGRAKELVARLRDEGAAAEAAQARGG